MVKCGRLEITCFDECPTRTLHDISVLTMAHSYTSCNCALLYVLMCVCAAVHCYMHSCMRSLLFLQDSEKRSPLHAAAHCGEAEIADILLLAGARVNSKDSRWLTPLHRACASKSEVRSHTRHFLNLIYNTWQDGQCPEYCSRLFQEYAHYFSTT